MGKPGGFFKRLKAKEHRQDQKNKRGTTGRTKEDRIKKKNADIQYHAAQRQLRDLDTISTSSDEGVNSDDADEFGADDGPLLFGAARGSGGEQHLAGGAAAAARRADPNLLKLHDMLGITTSSSATPTTNNNKSTTSVLGQDRQQESDEEDEDVLPFDDEEEEEEEELEELEEFAEEDDDDLPEEELLLGEEEEDEELFDEEGLYEDDEELLDDEELGEEEEEDEEEEPDNDEAVFDPSLDEDARLPKKEVGLLLRQFALVPTSANATISSFVDTKRDPWFKKYYAADAADAQGDGAEQSTAAATLLPAATCAKHIKVALPNPNEEGRERQLALQKEKEQQFDDEGNPRKQKSTSSLATSSATGVAVQATKRALVRLASIPPHPSRQTIPAAPSDSVKAPKFIHSVLWKRWVAFRQRNGAKTPAEILTSSEYARLCVYTHTYSDVLDTTRGWDSADSFREVAVLHLLNHAVKARSVVAAHNKLLEAKAKAKKKPANEGDEEEEEEEDDDLRDRGFGMTRLMLVLPLRNIALRYVETIVDILDLRAADDNDHDDADGAKKKRRRTDVGTVKKLNQFRRDFSEIEEAVDPTFRRRPLEYRRQFEGNVDDSFCLGMSLGLSSAAVYSHVLNSDLLICSPLGLRKRAERNADCMVALSSIEVCVVDQAHVLLMQNWEHVTAVLLEMLNKIPKDTTEGLADISRVFPWSIEGSGAKHRQTLVFSDVAHATFNALMREMVNSSGRVVLGVGNNEGILGKVMVPIRQHFVRFTSPNGVADVDDARFDFFTESIFKTKVNPLIERNVRTILFVPSYFDFVRVKHYLHQNYQDSFVALSEYTSVKKQRQALGQFTDQEKSLLLMTERFYFFKRYFVKLAEVMVFYAPPVFPNFYFNLVGKLVATSPNATVITPFCKYDFVELCRIVGSDKAKQMLEREASAFAFVTSASSSS